MNKVHSEGKKNPEREKKNQKEVDSKNPDEKKSIPPEYKKDTISIFDDLFFFDSEGWDITRKLFLKLKQEVKKNGGELAVIHFGGFHQYRNFPVLPVKEFDAFLNSEGIEHYNAFDLFVKIDDEFLPENFIPNDGHFTETGHRHFADFSTDFLLGLIEKAKI